MEIITNTLGDFFNAESQLWEYTVIALILLSILAIVLLIGWKVNNKNPKSMKEPVLFLKEECRKENFPKKGYIDIKR